MKKIPNIFIRSFDSTMPITKEKNPLCNWVFKGEGVATRKYDGTACLVKNGKLYKRRTVRKNKPKPTNFIEADFDPKTGKTFGWIPVDTSLKENIWYKKAFYTGLPDGTYELIGEYVQGNPEKLLGYQLLMSHKLAKVFPNFPRTYEGIKEALTPMDVEGVVFHHPDGRMAKIRKRDFGLIRVGKLVKGAYRST